VPEDVTHLQRHDGRRTFDIIYRTLTEELWPHLQSGALQRQAPDPLVRLSTWHG